MNKRTRQVAIAALFLLGTFGLVTEAQGNKKITFLSVVQEDLGISAVITSVTKDYQKTNPNVSYEFQYIAQNDLVPKLELLTASDNLPTLYNVGDPVTVQQLAAKGYVADIEATFKKLGIWDRVNPAAAAVVKSQYGGKMLGLPLELNIEGIWYNKKLFAENGIKEPTTWDAMIAAAEVFNKQGIIAFSASGDQKWPLTRLLNGYIARKYGANAMQRVADGDLKLTDAGFIEAARAVQNLGKKGYFGPGVNTIDYQTSVDNFLTGKAAMMYMGSWVLGNFNDPKQNKIGDTNIGMFNFPNVAGGKGSRNDWSMNNGIANIINQKQNDAALGDWLKAVATNYGNRALADFGSISGFKVTKSPKNLPILTKLTQQRLNKAKNAYLWFEGKLSSKASSVATDNMQLLVTGDMTPETYMTELQAALK